MKGVHANMKTKLVGGLIALATRFKARHRLGSRSAYGYPPNGITHPTSR